jgi:hypothetical protein
MPEACSEASSAVQRIQNPANPPSVGAPETIGYRTGLYCFMVLLSMATMGFAMVLGRRLSPLLGNWNAALLSGTIFIIMIAIIQVLMPNVSFLCFAVWP